MRLPDGDLRLDRSWTEGPALPFLGLAPDSDVLVVMCRPIVTSLLEFNLAETLDRVIELAVGRGARVWVKSVALNVVRATHPGFGLESWLGMPDARVSSFDTDAELGKALSQSDPLPNGRPVSHLVWMDDGTHLPGDILRHFSKIDLPFSVMIGSEDPIREARDGVRTFLRKQRPGMRTWGLADLTHEEIRQQTAVLQQTLDEAVGEVLPVTRPARRL